MKKLFKILLILCAVFPYAAGAGEVQINLKAWTTDGLMTTQTLTVQDCEDSAGSGNFTLNGMCAVDQSGFPALWTWWGTDAFLDSWNGYIGNANGNGIYWAWFGNRELGATALNTHILSADEELFLTYGPNPLRLTVDDTTPDVGQAITITVEEFGYDINWNAVWSLSNEALVSVDGNPGGLTDASGVYSFTPSDESPINVRAAKNSFADSNEMIIDPNDPPPPPPPPPPSGGGSVVLIQTPPPPKNFDLTAAINFILSRQKPDGSFGDSLYTDWAAIALGATETGEHAEAKERLRSYLKEHSLSADAQLTDYERGAMALMSLGMNPYEQGGHNYIAEIVKSFDGEQFGDPNLFNDDIFAILVLTNAGYGANDSMLQSVARWLLAKQSVQGDFSGVDLTAAFIQALESLSSLPDIAFSLDRAKNYLRGRQESNGGLSSIFGTSWALQTSAISRESGLRYLALFQLSDGGLQDTGLTSDGRLWATAYAVPAVLGKNWNEILLDFTKPVTQTLEFFEAEAMPSKEFSRSSSRSVSAPASGVETKLAQPDAQKFSDGPALTITAVASSTDPMDSKESVGAGWILCFFLRMLPFRPPNIEPVLAFQMPFAKRHGYIIGFIFAFFNIILYDLLTAGLGPWTFMTATAYGFLGLWAAYFFRKRESTGLNYAVFAIMGTLFYDAVTGLTLGPLFFNQPFAVALAGQVPFTALHLLGNVGLAFFVSPLVNKWISTPLAVDKSFALTPPAGLQLDQR